MTPQTYTKKDFSQLIHGDDTHWNDFQYLPNLSDLQFDNGPCRGGRSFYGSPHYNEAIIVGQLDQPDKTKSNVWAYVRSGPPTSASAPNLVRYYITNQRSRLTVTQINNIEFYSPFKETYDRLNPKARDRLRFLICFYFLEKNILNLLVADSSDFLGFATTCATIAKAAKAAGKLPSGWAKQKSTVEAKGPETRAVQETSKKRGQHLDEPQEPIQKRLKPDDTLIQYQSLVKRIRGDANAEISRLKLKKTQLESTLASVSTEKECLTAQVAQLGEEKAKEQENARKQVLLNQRNLLALGFWRTRAEKWESKHEAAVAANVDLEVKLEVARRAEPEVQALNKKVEKLQQIISTVASAVAKNDGKDAALMEEEPAKEENAD